MTEAWVPTGRIYDFRTADDDGPGATNISAIFMGGESYGYTQPASGGEFDITVLGGETSSNTNRSGTMADLSIKVSFEDIRDNPFATGASQG